MPSVRTGTSWVHLSSHFPLVIPFQGTAATNQEIKRYFTRFRLTQYGGGGFPSTQSDQDARALVSPHKVQSNKAKPFLSMLSGHMTDITHWSCLINYYHTNSHIQKWTGQLSLGQRGTVRKCPLVVNKQQVSWENNEAFLSLAPTV